MSKIVIVGAGKTGRGFLARLLQEAGKEVVFIDKNQELVDALNRDKEFQIRFFGGVRESYTVNNFVAYTWEEAEIKDILAKDVELIFVSVGGQNLKDVGASLAKVLAQDKKYYIITAENASKPSKTLKDAVGKQDLVVSESTVFCTTIEEEGIHINSENYPYLQCNVLSFICIYILGKRQRYCCHIYAPAAFVSRNICKRIFRRTSVYIHDKVNKTKQIHCNHFYCHINHLLLRILPCNERITQCILLTKMANELKIFTFNVIYHFCNFKCIFSAVLQENILQ